MKNKAMSFLGQTVCLLLAALLGVILLRTVTAGASAYQASRRALDSGYTSRTLVDYATAKVESGNRAGMVYVSDFEGIPCLTIEEEYYGEKYQTFIYCYEGMLKELFTLEDSGIAASEGTDIIACRAFEPVQVSPTLIYLSFNVDGDSEFGYVSVVDGGEVTAR